METNGHLTQDQVVIMAVRWDIVHKPCVKLPRRLRKALRAHLKGCEPCRKAVEAEEERHWLFDDDGAENYYPPDLSEGNGKW